VIDINKLVKKGLYLISILCYYILVKNIPDILSFNITKKLRLHVCKYIFSKSSDRFHIESGVYFGNGKDIEIGYGSGLGKNVHIYGIGGGGHLILGDHCMIAPETIILTTEHKLDEYGRVTRGENATTIKIGDYSWIGIRSIILPGVTIGENTIIGAGAVVTKDIPPNTVAVGVPAKVIREIKPR
jgi:maltose O-acetyltransferase